MTCPHEIDRMFGIPWPMTARNTERRLPCPLMYSGNHTYHILVLPLSMIKNFIREACSS